MDNESTLTIDDRGNKQWRLLNGALHRVGGPACEYANGDKSWYLDGDYHRVDGPALEWADDHIYWYLYDKHYTFDDWLEANYFISEEEKLMLKLTYG
jgi:hypothetical protein